ncbi:Annexin [Violaceomyces palustris]|uniref:Annexin n=1 Tax=Violaceomyces palustris TaxID=1673888 RepID=A0ACD0P5W8_9BASI|nr:Annexin [Violaceomyces palustris]
MSWGQHPNQPYPPQQQGYGAPPPHGYAPPPQAPPGWPGQPQQQYGAPPGPPPQAYGAPAGYGAPPPQHHAYHQAQPYHQQPPAPYGAPSGGFFYLGIPIPPPPPHQPAPPPMGYNPAQDVERIRKATKGFGTDEGALISTLAPLDAFQVDALRHTFKAQVGKDLVTVLEKETSGWFENVLRAKVLGPVGFDVWLINRACQGAGTHEDLLNEVLLARTNSEIHVLKQAYQATYGKNLEKVVEQELSFKTKRLFTMAMQGVRMEDSAPVDHAMVEADIRALKSAARGAGTDEIAICGILVQRSTPHLQAVAAGYQRQHGKLSKMINSEFSGHMEDALRFIVDGVEADGRGVERDARLIEDSMKGMGTKDERLIYRVVRAHWNRARFEQVKRAYAATQNKKGLKNRIEGETSGDYKRMLCAIVGSS